MPPEEDWVTAIGNMHRNLVMFGHVVFVLYKQTDKHRNMDKAI